MIRRAKRKDINLIVQIHMTSLSDDFLPSLGEEFLLQLYSSQLKNDTTRILIWERENRVRGFIMGTINLKKLYITALMSHRFLLCFLLIKKIAKNPSLLNYVFQSIFYPKVTSLHTGGEIMVIAVDPNERGKQIGTKLIFAMESFFKEFGIEDYSVSTLASYPKANSFYKKLKFIHISDFTLYNKRWKLYTKSLSK